MAKRVRNYEAEYQRRLELGRQRGQTKAQARRGAKKYAGQAPREHVSRAATTQRKYKTTPREVTRRRLARRQVSGVGKARHNVQRFHKLDRAMDFAGELPDRAGVYIVGHGTFRNMRKYEGKARGWAALNEFTAPRVYRTASYRAYLHQQDQDIFNPHATTYEVRWSEE